MGRRQAQGRASTRTHAEAKAARTDSNAAHARARSGGHFFFSIFLAGELELRLSRRSYSPALGRRALSAPRQHWCFPPSIVARACACAKAKCTRAGWPIEGPRFSARCRRHSATAGRAMYRTPTSRVSSVSLRPAVKVGARAVSLKKNVLRGWASRERASGVCPLCPRGGIRCPRA